MSYLTSVAKQAKTAFLHGPTVWKSLIVGIEPATFRSESAALATAPRDPTLRTELPYLLGSTNLYFVYEIYENKVLTKNSGFTVHTVLNGQTRRYCDFKFVLTHCMCNAHDWVRLVFFFGRFSLWWPEAQTLLSLAGMTGKLCTSGMTQRSYAIHLTFVPQIKTSFPFLAHSML